MRSRGVERDLEEVPAETVLENDLPGICASTVPDATKHHHM